MIRDATAESFESEVLDRSKLRPVVVDFWAPWCAPCRALAPLLERLAEEHADEFDLVRVNVDEAAGPARSYGVTSIPAVKAFRDGQVVAEFVGAQPESDLRRFLSAVLPSPADRRLEDARREAAAGRVEAAEAAVVEALELDPHHPAALLSLARHRADAGDPRQALELLERIGPGTPESSEAERVAAELRFELSAEEAGGDPEALRARIAADSDDHEARIALGRLLVARGELEEALAVLLASVERDSGYADASARKAMLDVFAMIGADHPLTQRFRAALGRALFR